MTPPQETATECVTPARGERVYTNTGNAPLIELVSDCARVLDVGCGSGANARLLKARFPAATIDGISVSAAEAEAAASVLDRHWVFDIEHGIPADLAGSSFDTLIFSHVLEHLREPERALASFVELLEPGGQVVIAVPNVLFWRQRLKFIAGKFEYEAAGILDDTHLRFFTWFTADSYLLKRCPGLELTHKRASGSVPLWWLRRQVLPARLCAAIDRAGCRWFPNLFGGQVLIRAIRA